MIFLFDKKKHIWHLKFNLVICMFWYIYNIMYALYSKTFHCFGVSFVWGLLKAVVQQGDCVFKTPSWRNQGQGWDYFRVSGKNPGMKTIWWCGCIYLVTVMFTIRSFDAKVLLMTILWTFAPHWSESMEFVSQPNKLVNKLMLKALLTVQLIGPETEYDKHYFPCLIRFHDVLLIMFSQWWHKSRRWHCDQ